MNRLRAGAQAPPPRRPTGTGRPHAPQHGEVRRAFIGTPIHGLEMSSDPALEVRLEVCAEGGLPAPVADKISAVLSQRWPGAWDVKLPPRSSVEHPAEWRSVVPLPAGATAETLHNQVAADVLALDASRSLRFRTRWAFQESPNHQEVYEVRWDPDAA